MERKFYIAKSIMKDRDSVVLYHLLEENHNGLVDAIPSLAGGEQSFKIICKKLCEMLKVDAKSSIKGFTVSSIDKISMRVKSDSELTLFHTLRDDEIVDFYNCYRLVGNY